MAQRLQELVRAAASVVLFCSACTAPPQSVQTAAAAGKWDEDLARFAETDRRSPPPLGAVLFVGSSSIRMWETLAQDFPGVQTINRGFGGSELGDVADLAERLILPYKPRVVVLYAGDNDIEAGKSPEQVFASYQRVVSHVRRELPETRILFVSIKPSLARWRLIDRIRAANALVRRYAAGDPRLAYVDVFTPMLGADGTPRKELFLDDGLHMNAQGYAIWRSVLAPYLGT